MEVRVLRGAFLKNMRKKNIKKPAKKSSVKKKAAVFQRTEAFYKQLVEQSNDAICTLDLKGRVVYANKAAEKITKIKFEQSSGVYFWKYLDKIHIPLNQKIRR